MSITAWVGKKEYEGDSSNHTEQKIFRDKKNESGNLTIEMEAWPCTGEHAGKNCHELLRKESVGRIITLQVTDDSGGYSQNHGRAYGETGTIVYNNGIITFM